MSSIKIDGSKYSGLVWPTARFRQGDLTCDHNYDTKPSDCDMGEGLHFACSNCGGHLCVEFSD